MLMLGYFILASLLAFLLLRRLAFVWYLEELLAASVVLGTLFGGSMALAWSLLLPYGTSLPLAAASIVGLIGILLLQWNSQPAGLAQLTKPRIIGWLIVTITLGGLLCYLMYANMLRPDADGWHAAGSTWGDLPVHTAFITYFANHDNFSFNMPLFYHGKLVYHFLADFISALYFRTGLSLRWSLLIPAITLSLSLIQLLFFLGLRLFKRLNAAVLSLILFLFGGTTGGIIDFWQLWRKSGQSLTAFLSHLPKDFTLDWDHNMFFSNIVTNYLMPQRSSMLGLATLCLAVIIICQIIQKPQKKLWGALILGLMFGLMPFAQIHTFLMLGLLLGWLALTELWRTKTLCSVWTWALVIGLAVALPQVVWLYLQGAHGGYGYWHFSWTKTATQNFGWFWLYNWGPACAFLILTPLLIFRSRHQDWLRLYVPFGLMFIAANSYSFQPITYDNIKLLYFTYLAVCLSAGYFLSQWYRRSWLATLFCSCIIAVWISSGALAVIWHFQVQQGSLYMFARPDDLAFAEAVKSAIPIDSTVLTPLDVNQPIVSLAGRPVVMGYYAWAYGLPTGPVEFDEKEIYRGSEKAPALLAKYEVDYVYLDKYQTGEWAANTGYFLSRYPVVHSDSHRIIVQVTGLP